MDAISEFRRDILVSIRPNYASKILNGQKTVELRRKFPEVGAAGALALIYSSSPVSAVVGYARIKFVLKLPVFRIWKEYRIAACISKDEFDTYFTGANYGFVIFLENVKSLRRQLKATDLVQGFGIVPPQSYRYVDEECVALLSDERFQNSGRYKRSYRVRGPSARSSISR